VPRTFQEFNVFFRTVVALGFVLLACWWTMFLKSKLATNERELEARTTELASAKGELAQRQAEIAERQEEIRKLGVTLQERTAEIARLEEVVAEKERQLQALEFANSLLKVSHRVARIEVLAQQAPPEALERVRTTVRFTELGPDGQPLATGHELTIEGKTLYVEALVIQFEDRYVEQGDALRGTSLCFFKRIFGENQSPSAGPALDTAGQQPLACGGDTTIDPVHRALWERFWDYANDPALAKELGVRALQGEAPFIEARPGKTYRLELRASGGLVIEAE
jgi:Tfp pilus assembly protein PilN